MSKVNIGAKYNHWTVLQILGRGGYCLCQCDCENKTIKVVRTNTLIQEKSKSCGCTKRKVKVNDIYGRLTVVELNVGKTKDGKALHKCICECGNICYVKSGKLRSGHTKSCGCLRKRGDNFENHK